MARGVSRGAFAAFCWFQFWIAICVPGKPGVNGEGWTCASSGRRRLESEEAMLGDCGTPGPESGPVRLVSVESSS